MPSVYRVPLLLDRQGVLQVVIDRLQLPRCPKRQVARPTPTMEQWRQLVDSIEHCNDRVQIALVGKYVESEDAYKSVKSALSHASIFCGRDVQVVPIQSDDLEGGEEEDKQEQDGDKAAARKAKRQAAWAKLKAAR